MITDPELKEVVRVVESKLAEGVNSYSSTLDGLRNRIKELEQKGAGGYGGGAPTLRDTKRFSAKVAGHEAFKAYRAGNAKGARLTLDVGDLELKNTILGESGSPQEPSNTIVPSDRLPGIVGGAFRSLNILDFIPVGQTDSNRVDYTRESAWTNDAAETAEGAEKPESDLTFELVEDPVRTIAHWIRVSKQVLDDSAALSSYLDRRMRHGVRAKLQAQIIGGNGTSPNLSGITDSGRHTAFTPTTGHTALDSLNRAKYLVIAADYTPNFILLNPADVGAIERAKRNGTDDEYIGADGLGARYVETGYRGMLWQLPVIATNDLTAGKFILGDSMAMQLFMRQESTVEISDSDDDNFTKNLLTIRAELRAALAVFTPAAIQYGDLTQ